MIILKSIIQIRQVFQELSEGGVTMFRVVIVIMILFLFCGISVADRVVVGEKDGCNLVPHYMGLETSYIIAGERAKCQLASLGFPNRDADFTQVLINPIGTIEMSENKAVVRMPSPATYEIRFSFIPRRTGLLRLDIHTEGDWVHDATVFIKILPQGAPLPYDVNWDGVLDRQDIRDLISQRNYGQTDVTYYRCDLDRNSTVDKSDLVLVIREIQKLKPDYNPWDLDENGYIDIHDFVILNDGDKQQREQAKFDRNKDGIVTIADFVLKAVEAKTKTAPPAPTPKRKLPGLPTQWSWGKTQG